MPAAPLCFLVGSTGAGKTTYARRVCEETGAVRFSVDEWMTALFWMDSPQPIEPGWAMERVERCSRTIWRSATQVAAAGVPCLLELGFSSRATRSRYAALAAEAGLAVELHILDVPAEERWRRVQRRNLASAAGAQLSFAVTREMFDFTEGFWEPPDADEVAPLAGRYVSA